MHINLLNPNADGDLIDQWINARCIKGSGRIAVAELFASWKAYTEEHQEFTGTISKFSRELSRRGWVRITTLDGKRSAFAGWGIVK